MGWEKWTKTDPSMATTTAKWDLNEVFTDKVEKKAEPHTDEPPMMKAPVPIEKLIGKDPVPLSEAVDVYQPVKGTSSSSRYFAVGFTYEGLQFAARYDDSTLSIRCEGDVGKHKAALVTAGFSESYIESKGNYTSVHFHGLTKIMAQRTLGAVLSGTGLDFYTTFPKVDEFKDKGA
jgi:hypothetical protein